MQREKILVVDDDKNICELLRMYLEKEGYVVVMAHNGLDAVNTFNTDNPDLVLLDICFHSLTVGRYAVKSEKQVKSQSLCLLQKTKFLIRF